MPKVSVIIPNYNYARYVGKAIESVLGQTYSDFEIVVVDNGSSDDSPEVLKTYQDRYPEKFRYVLQENQGQAGSRNRGIQEAQSPLVAFLDADDVWLPNKLEKQIPFFENEKVGLVYCGYTVTDRDLNPIETIVSTKRGDLLEEFAAGPGAVVLGGETTSVIRKKCFDELGGFDPNLSISTGWDMFRRIASRYQIEVVDEPLAYYRQHGNNAHQRIDIYEHDVRLRLKKMFSDPNSSRVHGQKRNTYAKMYQALAGSYFQTNQYLKTAEYTFRALLTEPKSWQYFLSYPARRFKREQKHESQH